MDWIGKFYRNTLTVETAVLATAVYWKYNNTELVVYALLNFINCIILISDIPPRHKLYGFIGLLGEKYMLFCLILPPLGQWFPIIWVIILSVYITFLKLAFGVVIYWAIITMKKYKPNYKLVRSCNTCSICLIDLTINEDGKSLLKCNHIFHPGCIDRWITNNDTCPNCRCNVYE